MKPTDSKSAENSDILHSKINAIREAFDSSDDDDDVTAAVRRSAEFVVHAKSIKSDFCIRPRVTYSARPVIRNPVLPQPVATSTS